VGFREVERPVESAVLVREGVVAVGVGLDARVEVDGSVLLAAELEGRLLGRIEPRRNVVDVRHRRR